MNAESFFIVSSGSLEIASSETIKHVTRGEVSYVEVMRGCKPSTGSQPALRVGKGTCLGEASMLYCAPRYFTAKALETTVLWRIDRSNFQVVLMKAAEDHMKDRVKHPEKAEDHMKDRVKHL